MTGGTINGQLIKELITLDTLFFLRLLRAKAAGVAMASEMTVDREAMMRLLTNAFTHRLLCNTSLYHLKVKSVNGQLKWLFPEKELKITIRMGASNKIRTIATAILNNMVFKFIFFWKSALIISPHWI